MGAYHWTTILVSHFPASFFGVLFESAVNQPSHFCTINNDISIVRDVYIYIYLTHMLYISIYIYTLHVCTIQELDVPSNLTIAHINNAKYHVYIYIHCV